MGGFFSHRAVLFGVGSGPLVWCRVAWLTNKCAKPIVAWTTPSSHSKGPLHKCGSWPWELGLKLAHEKGSFGPETVLIGTHVVINAKTNKMGGTIKHDEVRRVASTESWVASFQPQLKPFVRQLATMFEQPTGSRINLICKRQVWRCHGLGCSTNTSAAIW